MIRRVCCALLIVGAVTAAMPEFASAHGPVRRGLEIDHNQTISLTTGFARQNWKWVTVGLNPGRLTVGATLVRCGRAVAPTCGLVVSIFHGGRSLRAEEVGCYASKHACGNRIQIQYNVTATGVYYVVVQGMGSENIPYRLHVQGNIFALHCRKYC